MICGLVAEGSSDRVLVPLLRWVLKQSTPADFRVVWVDTSFIRTGPSLAEKLAGARAVQPCDLLFVHRDSDGQPPEHRRSEIEGASAGCPHVPVVPVRMTEAWLLFDEGAIRAAAGRPSGREDLGLPPLAGHDKAPDPKHLLHSALARAYAATGRRARRFNSGQAVHRVAQLVQDWSPLRAFAAFRQLEQDTRAALVQQGRPVSPREEP